MYMILVDLFLEYVAPASQPGSIAHLATTTTTTGFNQWKNVVAVLVVSVNGGSCRKW